jgi:hypothetical protein
MRRMLGFVILALLSGTGTTAQASPLRYTFSGTVSRANYVAQWDGLPDLPERNVGDAVSFLVEIDLGTQPAGLSDYGDGFTVDYFAARYVSGSSLYPSAGAYFGFTFPSYGCNAPDWAPAAPGALFAPCMNGADFGDSAFRIASWTRPVSAWVPGERLWAQDYLYVRGAVTYDLTLTSVNDGLPVAEPASLLLLGGGLLGARVWRLRRR